LHITKWSNGRRRRNGNYTPQKNYFIEDLVGNGEKRPDHNKTMMSLSPVTTTKNPSKSKSWKKSQRNSWSRY
jgi:hypothetical protein